MLRIGRSGTTQSCDGLSRRDFLRVGSLGLGSLSLADVLRARASGSTEQRSGTDTSVVFLFLSGGPSHLDTYDPKPDAPAEFRGPFKPINTRIPGYAIAELMPRQAQVMDNMAVVRTFSHNDGNHGSAVHWVATGVLFPPADLGEPAIAPFPGSVAAKVKGVHPGTGMPPYLALHRMPTSDGPAYLGVGCAPFEVKGPGQGDLHLPGGIDLKRLHDRRRLLQSFDDVRRDIDHHGTISALDQFEQQAFRLILGEKARAAFDLTREDPRVVDRYGSGLGEQLLLARRLCEAGAVFVTIEWSGSGGSRYGWDNHRGVFDFLRVNVPVLDHAVATFVDDVRQRGLARQILLVIMGEMGRTPKINDNAGRDHWPQVMFVTLAGGGLKMGQVVGTTSSKGEVPTSRPFGAQDLLATIYHVLGIDLQLTFLTSGGRPMPIITQGQPIAELV